MKSKRFQKFAEDEPALLVKDGVYFEEGLKRARLSKKESQAHMRLNGIRTVKLSVVRARLLNISNRRFNSIL